MEPYSVVAFNTATASTNKIHDDAVASALGFRGGLVPGVDVYAYLTQAPVREWGRAWLERGTISARFHLPVYDGDTATVSEDPDDRAAIVLTDPRRAVCARATALLPMIAPAIDPALWPKPGDAVTVPPASPESLSPGTAFDLPGHRFHADAAGEYLDAVREVHPLYRLEGIAHPGWILRDANYVLSANVRLGPWIHVSSTVQHHGLVRDGEEMSARAIVTEEWEQKGHRFVRLDVLHLADGRAVARTDHVAIYRPRGTADL
jgi:acyl dehydratase